MAYLRQQLRRQDFQQSCLSAQLASEQFHPRSPISTVFSELKVKRVKLQCWRIDEKNIGYNPSSSFKISIPEPIFPWYMKILLVYQKHQSREGQWHILWNSVLVSQYSWRNLKVVKNISFDYINDHIIWLWWSQKIQQDNFMSPMKANWFQRDESLLQELILYRRIM